MPKSKTIKLDGYVDGVIRRASYDGSILRIEEKLARDDYLAVNKALEALGGKWNRRAKGHVFDADPRPLVDQALADGEVLDKVVLMNPPFSNGQDAAHVMAAWKLLKPGGRLVAVISAHHSFAGDRKAVAFRQWLTLVGAEVEDLPEDTFAESGTQTRAQLIFAVKDEAETARKVTDCGFHPINCRNAHKLDGRWWCKKAVCPLQDRPLGSIEEYAREMAEHRIAQRTGGPKRKAKPTGQMLLF